MTREEIMQLNTDYLNNCESEQEMNELFYYVLELQKHEQEPKWIPVSEKLPEIHQDVLLSLRSLDVEVGFRGNTEPYYYCHGDYVEPQNVLAWMPLPQPYKAESEE